MRGWHVVLLSFVTLMSSNQLIAAELDVGIDQLRALQQKIDGIRSPLFRDDVDVDVDQFTPTRKRRRIVGSSDEEESCAQSGKKTLAEEEGLSEGGLWFYRIFFVVCLICRNRYASDISSTFRKCLSQAGNFESVETYVLDAFVEGYHLTSTIRQEAGRPFSSVKYERFMLLCPISQFRSFAITARS